VEVYEVAPLNLPEGETLKPHPQPFPEKEGSLASEDFEHLNA
jgi:hypothetical protein